VVWLTFLEAWRKRGTIEVGVSLRPWLLGIAVNVFRNLARASRRGDAQIPRGHDAPPSRAWCP
jgi:RNA polymerase sigma-70 factor (ECF subfamily)